MNPCTLDESAEEDPSAGSGTSDVSRPAEPRQGASFDDVYERYFEFVWRSLRMLGVPRNSLDDAVQDVFNTIARQLAHFQGRSSLRTWVFGIAQYTAANHRRADRRKNGPLQPLAEELESAEPRPDAHVEAKQLADVVLSFCAELDAGRRAVFVLGLLEDVPAAEIAELLQIPVNTVYSRVRALKRALRQRLERCEVEQ